MPEELRTLAVMYGHTHTILGLTDKVGFFLKIDGHWVDKGLFEKKCQLSCSFVFCLSLLLFYSEMVHKQ